MLDSVTRMEVRDMLRRVKKGTAPGTEGIHYDLLCHGGDLVEDALLLLYNLVWSTGTSPDEWRKALIRPIYKPKTKDPSVIENYRAVTLINCTCKGFEDVLCQRITNHLEARKGIAPGQGARRHMSTEELV